MAKSYAVLIDILKRLPDDTTTLVELKKEENNNNKKNPHLRGQEGGTAQGEAMIREEIMPPLEKLMADEDVDVRFFATTAARSWEDGVGIGGAGKGGEGVDEMET